MKITPAMKRALKWLRNRGDHGTFEKNRQVLIAGGDRAPITRATWDNLAKAKLIGFYCERRGVRVTDLGRTYDLSNTEESDGTELIS